MKADILRIVCVFVCETLRQVKQVPEPSFTTQEYLSEAAVMQSWNFIWQCLDVLRNNDIRTPGDYWIYPPL